MGRQPFIWASINVLRALFTALPHRAALALGGSLGALVGRCTPRRYGEAVSRCERILGVPRQRAEEIVRGSYRHFGRAAAEFIRMPYASEHIDELVHVRGEENIKEALAKGKGVLIVTAHLGNWEYAASWYARHGYKINGLGADQRDDRITALIAALREAGGYRALGKATDMRAMIKALTRNEIIAVPIDQDAKEKGILSPFLGSAASTPLGPAKLADKIDCAGVPGCCVRRADGRTFESVYLPAMEGRNGKRCGEDAQESTDVLNEVRSGFIREHPEQWLWMYPRWESVERGWFDDVLRH